MADNLPPHQLRREGPTPAGGAYSIASFSLHGKPCPPDAATAVEIVEFRADGTEIHRTYGTIGASGDEPPPPPDPSPGPATAWRGRAL